MARRRCREQTVSQVFWPSLVGMNAWPHSIQIRSSMVVALLGGVLAFEVARFSGSPS
jgi:hypothetical protein